MTRLSDFLSHEGPSRSSVVSDWLVKTEGLSSDAARKRLSAKRLKAPLRAFPVPLLPKKEAFLYLQEQRYEERFWLKFLDAMRETGSVFGLSIDGMIARHGLVLASEFAVISGASASGVKGQLTATSVAERLQNAGVLQLRNFDGLDYWEVRRDVFGIPDYSGNRARDLTEKILLDGLRDWVRNMGMAAYNQVKIRGEQDRRPVSSYLFDLAGPSFLLPLQHSGKQQSYFVADVFSNTVVSEHQVNYFIRKASATHSLLRRNGAGLIAVLLASGFTGPALTAGHAAGVILTTPRELFGRRTGIALQNLLSVLSNTAAYVSAGTPDRIANLIEDLAEIEGASGNLRGVLFELLAAYLARRTAVSIDMGVRASDPETGKTADIDILTFSNQGSHCHVIECKGRSPGGTVDVREVENWIRRLPIFTAHLKAQSHLRESKINFALWTSGTFEPDARLMLENEKRKRIKHPISWKEGKDVLQLALEGKEKGIANALREHFLHHPLSLIAG
ncbi:hypothetical protein EV673_2070 [Limnobacter thiooxidans]|uniref:Uncharacterized protein n=1 Tax=Limnobacter thiooxidans TaxID=131080 RepID=A0AA86JHK6_9BURK|nr:hypothetical protein EV673_2070 [Limnobacter thiooxidans]BET27261.1 hypothetical protein RGQ30_27620 [Limnobacter thiooxidans]